MGIYIGLLIPGDALKPHRTLCARLLSAAMARWNQMFKPAILSEPSHA